MFWDGTRWVQPETPRPRRRGVGDWVATGAMFVVLALIVVPLSGATGAALPAITVSPSSTVAGGGVTVSGSGFPKNQAGYLALDGASGPAFHANGKGNFAVTLNVPANTTTGSHQVTAHSANKSTGRSTAQIDTVEASTSLTVTAGQPDPPPTPAPTRTPAPTAAPAPTPRPTTAPTAPPPAATPQPTGNLDPTATPSPAATPAATPAAEPGFVRRCGLSLCLDGRRWYLYGASDLIGLDNPDKWSGMAVDAGLNTVRVVNFLDEQAAPKSAAYDEWHWARVDRVIASAEQHGLHALLDLSTYRNLMVHAGVDPYALDWQPFLTFVANRTNTVSGLSYRSDPTIALVAFAGEVEPINTSANTFGITTSELTSFFTRTFSEWKILDPNHLVSSGGLLQIDWDSGIDWRAIFGAVGSDVCAIHDYSLNDQTITTPNVAGYCAAIGLPWITEEFGWEQSVGDSTRAARFQSMYGLQATYGAAGVGFWNLGTQVGGSTYDVNSGTPITWEAVRANAP